MKAWTIQAPAAIAAVGAILLIAASAALGTTYAYKLGHHFGAEVAVAFAAMALGGELLKPVAVERAFAAGCGLSRRMACLAVAAIAIGYSLAAELAFSAGARGDLAAGRAAEIKASRHAEAAAKRAGDELALLKAARSVGELEALIAGFKPQCRMVVTHGFRGDVCTKPTALQAELGRAKRRAELEATIAGAGKATGRVAEADPQAAVVAAYLAAAGRPVDAASVATWLHLLPVLLLEIGSAFGLLVAAGVDERRQPSPGRMQATVSRLLVVLRRRRTVAATVAELLTATVADAQSTTSAAATVARKSRPAARQRLRETLLVLEALRAAGRPLSNDELAVAMRVHKGTASKRVKALGAAVRKERVGRQVALSLATLN